MRFQTLLRSVRMAVALAGLALPAVDGTAQPAGVDADAYAALRSELRAGATRENIVSISDPQQHYAVRLPPAYRPERTWPVLLLMDPRGRAMIPVERFRDAADRRGYILVSSYDTASDTGEDRNSPAVDAMLTDAPHLASTQDDRFYLVGFSGTARTAWMLAERYPHRVAGIIAFGAGLPLGKKAPWDADFAFHGAAGVFGFNFDEMVQLDRNLDLRPIPHTFESFRGGHQWGPADVCSRSVDWMELVAMKTGRRPIDASLVDEIRKERWTAVRDLAAEHPYHALLEVRAMIELFQGLLPDADITGLRAAADSLGAKDAVQRAEQAQDAALSRYYSTRKRFAELLDALDSGSSPPDAAAMIDALEIATLQQQAEALANDEAEAIHAQSARRLLEMVYVQCTFYLPRDYVRDGRPAMAVLALEVADAVRRLDLETFLDVRGLGSLRDDPAFQAWVTRRGRP
jgi:dienelactone hydrolase